MTQLPDPISEVLEDTADEARVQRMWRHIDRAPAPRRRGARLAMGAAVLAAAAAIVAFVWSSRGPATGGPLALAGGGRLPAEVVGTVELTDRSRIRVSDGGRLALLANDGRAVAWHLHAGEARFEVTPGGPRTWTVETDLATVEVVGTVFTVTRDEVGVRVAVERGRVLVRGERVPDRAVALTRGQSVVVPAEQPTERAESASIGSASTGSASTEVGPSAPSDGPVATSPTAEAREVEEPRAALDAEALMARADEARRGGQLERAATLLERASRRPGDPSAGLAAFTLGRLELGALSRPDRAARAFERALSLPLTPRLREDAAARRVEALRRAGRPDAARVAAEAYLRDYPDGRFASTVRASTP